MMNLVKVIIAAGAVAILIFAVKFLAPIISPAPTQSTAGGESPRPLDIAVPKAPEQKVDETKDQYTRRKQVYEANLDGLIYASTDAIESRCNSVGWKVVSFDTNETGKGTVKMEVGSVGANLGREVTQTTRWAYAMTQNNA